jgi:hypothetical protein
MAKTNKFLPYIIFGVPILIGGFFLFRYLKSKKSSDTNKGNQPTNIGNENINIDKPTPTPSVSGFPLRKGSRGEYVKSVQKKLGIVADGIFGSQTDTAVRNYQKTKNLAVDGIVGKNTWKSMFNADFPSTGTNAPVNPSGTPLKGLGKTSTIVSGSGGKTGYLIKDI